MFPWEGGSAEAESLMQAKECRCDGMILHGCRKQQWRKSAR